MACYTFSQLKSIITKTIFRGAEPAHRHFGASTPSLTSSCSIVKEEPNFRPHSVLFSSKAFYLYTLEHEQLIMSIWIGRNVDELNGAD